jgi:hypothetical protein
LMLVCCFCLQTKTKLTVAASVSLSLLEIWICWGATAVYIISVPLYTHFRSRGSLWRFYSLESIHTHTHKPTQHISCLTFLFLFWLYFLFSCHRHRHIAFSSLRRLYIYLSRTFPLF